MGSRAVKGIDSDKLEKCPTGIKGLDEITGGGLPRGRPTLVCGEAGSGKTLLAMEFLIHGARLYGEPGVFMSFEESERELKQNVESLGFGLPDLVQKGKVVLDNVVIERNEIEETGEYDLEGLFIRIGQAIDSVKAKRVVLDTIESLFSGLPNEAILRAEIRRLFKWLKAKGVTAVITGERGSGGLTRHGLEEYVSDCVIVLDHRVDNLISTRRLRVLKYRGTLHGTNEYPFMIDEGGLQVLPITSIMLDYSVPMTRVSSGISRLDAMLGGEGFYRGSSILVSGTAGTGKTSLAAHFANATCKSGERCLYLAFEESPLQLVRNMQSIGINLQPYLDSGLLQINAIRSTFHGLEGHLTTIHKAVETFKPSAVIIDPVSNLISVGGDSDVKSMLTRLIDYLKNAHITAFFTNLTHRSYDQMEQTEYEISSLMDTWILLRDIELGGERNRGLYILKSRGMAHSNQIREFLLTSKGIDLKDVYIGPEGVLTGSARQAQEAHEEAERKLRTEEANRLRLEVDRKKRLFDLKVEMMRNEYVTEEEALKKLIGELEAREKALTEDRRKMGVIRKVDRDSEEKKTVRRA